MILGETTDIKEGDQVRQTGRVISVPVGEACSAESSTRSGSRSTARGPIETTDIRLETNAPGVVERQPVKEPLQTGIKAIDAMIPIGRGPARAHHRRPPDGKDRDRARHDPQPEGPGGVYCIYVAIGQKLSNVAQVVDMLKQHGAMEYTTVVVASASDPAPCNTLRRSREWRSASTSATTASTRCGLRRPLEARRRLSSAVAASSTPARPRGIPRRRVLPTQPAAGARRKTERRERRRLSDSVAYHRNPVGRRLGLHSHERHFHHRRTDLSSPTCSSREFDRRSTSGSPSAASAATPRSRRCGRWPGSLRLDLAQYRGWRLSRSSASELDKATQAQLNRGRRMVEILKQDQYEPLPMERQVMIIYARTTGIWTTCR